MNKYGAIAYGPMAALSGYLLAADSAWAWLGLIPAVWFVGMIFSHLVFKRCVLTELAARMSHFKSRNKAMAAVYADGSGSFNGDGPGFVEGVDGVVIADDGFPKPIKKSFADRLGEFFGTATSTTTVKYETNRNPISSWASKTVS